MSSSNRASRLAKTHKTLKKHYKSVASPSDRSVLEHMLYACCLENARFEDADEAYGKLQESYFDWNEVRVTTIAELAESMSSLPDSKEAASRLKRCLQSVFESHYSFDLEYLGKQNIGKATKDLERYDGTTRFVAAYVTQHGLGGHAIPINKGSLSALQVLAVVSDAEARKHRVPGIERAISKSKGIEFGSLIHQFGADYAASPFSPRVRAIFVEIDPEAKQRLPKRGSKKASEPTTNGQSSRGSGRPKKKKSSATRASAKPKKDSGKGSRSGKKKSVTKRIARRKPR